LQCLVCKKGPSLTSWQSWAWRAFSRSRRVSEVDHASLATTAGSQSWWPIECWLGTVKNGFLDLRRRIEAPMAWAGRRGGRWSPCHLVSVIVAAEVDGDGLTCHGLHTTLHRFVLWYLAIPDCRPVLIDGSFCLPITEPNR
jgi:hypothetical protein